MKTTLGRLACLALLGAACSGSGSSGSDGTPPGGSAASREDYAARLAEWLCDELAACCDGSGRTIDRDACIATKRDAELRRVAREEGRSGRGFDETMAGACVARLAETPATCGHPRRVPECFRTYDGLRELGESCTSRIQCRGSLRGDVACIEGVCTERLAAGEACTETIAGVARCDVCRPEARCREAADGGRYCFALDFRRGVAGDPCVDDPILPADPTDVTVVASCKYEDGLYCALDGVCTPLSPLGGACRSALHCTPGARCVDGTCAPGLAAGETCGFRDCGAGLYCRWTDYRCTGPGPVPGTCDGYELFSGVCAAPSGEGEPCGRFVDCAEGLHCTSFSEANDGVCERPQDACTGGLERLQRQASVQ